MSSDPSAAAKSPLVPVRLGLDDVFRFRCRKGIACFNRCCEHADILLTPYDIVRLKRRLALTARQFIERYTVPHAMDGHGLPGLKLRSREGSAACVFLTPEGCGVYPDRPAACRYYALGLLALRRQDASAEEDSYFLVKEEHCLGHLEPHTQTVREYRREQGLEEYDEVDREWRRIILKKRSAGPALGRPSARSFELFYLASYDVERLREFVLSRAFDEAFALDPALREELMHDDAKLLVFGFRLLRQALFGEPSLAPRPGVREQRLARLRERRARAWTRHAAAVADEQDGFYESLEDD